MKRLACIFAFLGLLVCPSVWPASPAPVSRPSILFCSPNGMASGYINLTYARELHEKGFEVDYTETLEEFLNLGPERIRSYNVLVIYITPDVYRMTMQNQRSSPDLAEKFRKTVDEYVSAGGGVFLMPWEWNSGKQMVGDLTGPWNIQVTGELIDDGNPAFVGKLTNTSYDCPLLYTDNIQDTPLKEGVKGIWYPVLQHYNGSATEPLIPGREWRSVVKGSASSRTYALKDNRVPWLAGVINRKESVVAPDLFAIREYGSGRIAVMATMPQYSIGSGTGLLFDREVLSKGVNGRSSDFGKLLENTYRWLAEPSLKSRSVGGYVTRQDALVPLNYRKLVKEFTDYTYWFWEYDVAQWHVPPKNAGIFKGLIGAQTAYSDGRGTVAGYKEAAERAGLDFVVFMENFDRLTKEKYDQLVADCRNLSDSRVKLIPGYTIRDNIGDFTLCIAEDGFWPADNCLTGPDKKLLNLQPEISPGVYRGYTDGSAYVNGFYLGHDHGPRNLGYYNWAGSPPGAMRMPWQRNAALAGVRYYRDGKLVEDMTDDYLTTLQSTMPPSPVSVNEVRSPEELVREVKSGHSLTYAQARNISAIMEDALRWSGTVDGMNVFLSDGPVIHEWPACYRPMTFGGEEFVTIPSVMESPLRVTSDIGLKAIRIYNGQELFRYFRLNGEKEFCRKLVLDGTIMKNLAVIAEDVKGGRAVSFARRSYKADTRTLYFCSDHVNDPGGMRIFHGPGGLPVYLAPHLPVDILGITWDGGPELTGSLYTRESRPAIETDKGNEYGYRFNQYPLVETGDEGSVATSSRQDEVFADSVQKVINPWHTYGPVDGQSKFMEYTQRYKEYWPPTSGAPESDCPIRGVRTGILACAFRDEITFKQDFAIKTLRLAEFAKSSPDNVLVIGRKPDIVEREMKGAAGENNGRFRLADGDWFAVYNPAKAANAHLFVVKNTPVILQTNGGASQILIFADIEGRAVKAGDTYTFELVSLNSSADVAIRDTGAVKRLRSYLAEPENMQVKRGAKLDTAGFVDIAPEDYAVEVVAPKPSVDLRMTMPLRIPGLNRNWTAGLFQKSGYVKGAYGSGENRYRGLGVDLSGCAYVPLYPDKAAATRILAGHPITADERGREININVIHLFDEPPQWHVSVNNLTDKKVTTKMKQAMDLPGLNFREREITLAPGEYLVLPMR